jgi:hypothetical protein
MKNQWGHWYLYDSSLGPEGQVEQVMAALLTELDLQAGEGLSEDVLQAGTWGTLLTLVLRDEGEEGLRALAKEMGFVHS